MLNDGWNEGMTADESDAIATEMYRDAHPVCLSCEKPGCIPDECPSGSCDIEPLVTCRGELVHRGCVEAFERETDNVITICTGCQRSSDMCTCAIPVATDEMETTPVAPLSDREIAKLDPLGVFRRLAAVAALLLVCVSGVSCAGKAPAAEQVETVGQLSASYHSIAVAPLKHSAPPAFGGVAETGDIPSGPSALDELRREHAGAGDVQVEANKGGGLTTGEVR